VYPAFAAVAPYVIAVAELEEGVRIVSNLRDADLNVVALGLPIEVDIEQIDENIGLPYVRLARP